MDTSLQNLLNLAPYLNKEEKELVGKAYEFAIEAHKDQKRLSGEPYFNHLYGTAKNIIDLGMSGVAIAAGLLHDVIEDTETSAETIKEKFGEEVYFIVEGVSKLGHIRYHGTDRHNESLRKLFVAMSQDIRVILVKLCDRLHNMETLEFVPYEKQERIAKESLEIYAALAYRLGIRKLSKNLEDLAFPYVYPEEYKEIKTKMKEKRETESEALEKFKEAVVKELLASQIKNFKTDYRIKGIYSLYKKFLRKEKDLDKIYDIAAMRIVVQNQSDCYKVLGLIHSKWQPLPGKIKDYIAFPKQNGYQGLHTTVFTREGTVVEVQIKTEAMQKEAEYGIASHISYKSEEKQSRLSANIEWIKSILPKFIIKTPDQKINQDKNKDAPEWLKELVEYQNTHVDEASAMDEIKSDFLEKRIFVFTPKGDVVDLPGGSTVIDFAYAIHTDLGNNISGVEINGKFSNLNTELKNGDIIKIITRKNGKPNRKWLDFAKTSLARKQIKNLS